MEDWPHIRAVLAGPVPDLIVATWQEVASEHVATGMYRNYLTFERLFPDLGDETLAVHVVNTAPHARVLEDGHSGFHLPSKIDWGAALSKGTAKISKSGSRYLSIPFRHRTPGREAGGISSAARRTMMSPATYRMALKAADGDRAARAKLVQQGTRLSRPYQVMAGVPASLVSRALASEGQPGYTWRTRTYEGLRRYQQQNPETGSSSSSWLTFRTLSEHSVGWWIPPFGGYGFARITAARVTEDVRALVASAAEADVAAMISFEMGAP